METKLFNFNLPIELKEYLEKTSKLKCTNISQYIIDLIVDDRDKKTKKDNNDVKLAKTKEAIIKLQKEGFFDKFK